MMKYLKTLSDKQLLDELFKVDFGDYTIEEISSVKRIIWNGLQNNNSHVEIANQLKSINGNVADNATSLSKTLVKAYGRIRTLQKALIAEIYWFEYVGILYEHTCSFCKSRLTHHFHIDEILAMKNGNLEPAIFFGGGFECTHDWEPDPFYRV